MNAKAQNSDTQRNPLSVNSRRRGRKTRGHLNWVDEHMHIVTLHRYGFDRVPLPEKGERVVRRGRKATGQGWALIAGLPKDAVYKRQRTCQDFRAN
jgi:hypothetical protein